MTDQAIRGAVISTDATFRSAVRKTFEDEQAVDVQLEIVVPFVRITHGHLEELRYVDPEVVFLDLEEDPVLGCKLAQFLTESTPQRKIVATGKESSPELLMAAMQAGVNEFLPKPATPESLQGILQRLRRKLGTTTADGSRREPGKLLAFFAAKGGAGSTTVATNLGIQIHRLTGKRTVVVDLDLELGEIALFLGIEPRFSFVDLARNFHRMDAELLASFIECHPSGVHVLSAPYHPEKAESISADQIRQILTFLRQHYDYVVVDTSNSFTPRTMTALEMADDVFLVANVDLPSLRNIQRCQHLLSRMNGRDRDLKLIVNRHQPEADITLDDVEQALGLDVYWTLPNDYEAVIYSINTGQPVILDERCAYAHELQALGAKIAGLPGVVGNRRGWLSRSVDRVRNFLGLEEDGDDALMLPPAAVVGGDA